MDSLGAQVIVALILVGAFLLLPKARPRDEIDALAERKARELARRDEEDGSGTRSL